MKIQGLLEMATANETDPSRLIGAAKLIYNWLGDGKLHSPGELADRYVALKPDVAGARNSIMGMMTYMVQGPLIKSVSRIGYYRPDLVSPEKLQELIIAKQRGDNPPVELKSSGRKTVMSKVWGIITSQPGDFTTSSLIDQYAALTDATPEQVQGVVRNTLSALRTRGLIVSVGRSTFRVVTPNV